MYCRSPAAGCSCACLLLSLFFLSGAARGAELQTPGAGQVMPRPGPGDATVGRAVTETTIPYKVKGFRSARFGGDEAAVRKAIALDFQLPAEAVERFSHPLQRTTVLKLDLERLAPGRGPASLRYILGYRSRTLVQVDVLWQTAAGGREQVEDLISTGSVLGSYFDGFSWRKDSVRSLSLVSDDTVLVWQGGEIDGPGAVRVLLSGVQVSSGDQSQQEAADKVRVLQLVSKDNGKRKFYTVDAELNENRRLSLLVSYIADRDKPDIYVIPAGDF